MRSYLPLAAIITTFQAASATGGLRKRVLAETDASDQPHPYKDTAKVQSVLEGFDYFLPDKCTDEPYTSASDGAYLLCNDNSTQTTAVAVFQNEKLQSLGLCNGETCVGIEAPPDDVTEHLAPKTEGPPGSRFAEVSGLFNYFFANGCKAENITQVDNGDGDPAGLLLSCQDEESGSGAYAVGAYNFENGDSDELKLLSIHVCQDVQSDLCASLFDVPMPDVGGETNTTTPPTTTEDPKTSD